MVYTKQTWTDGPVNGTPVSAARLNYIEAGIEAAAVQTGFPIALIKATVVRSMAAGWNDVALDAADIDTAGGWAAASPSRWTVPAGQGGIYSLEAEVAANTPSSAAAVTVAARFYKNGAFLPGGGGLGLYGNSGGYTAMTGRKLVTLAAGDYITLQGYAGVAWTTLAATSEYNTYMIIQRIR